MAALIGKSFCDISAVALLKTILFVRAGSDSGAAHPVNSVRTKFPFFARPGPNMGRFGSRNTSRRKPVMFVIFVLKVMVYAETGGLEAVASRDLSLSFVNLVPTAP